MEGDETSFHETSLDTEEELVAAAAMVIIQTFGIFESTVQDNDRYADAIFVSSNFSVFNWIMVILYGEGTW
mgnify:CR=1 FL=1